MNQPTSAGGNNDSDDGVAEKKGVPDYDFAGLQALVKALPDLVFILDEDGRYIDILSDNTTLLFKEAEQLKGQLMRDVLPLEVATAAMNAVQNTLQTGNSNSVEYQLDVPAGNFWFEGLTSPFPRKSEEGKELVLWVARDVTARKQAELQKETLIKELQMAIDRVETLHKLLPICSSCKKIRDDQGYWKQVDEYISSHSDIQFSHGICPECMKQLYPDWNPKKPDQE